MEVLGNLKIQKTTNTLLDMRNATGTYSTSNTIDLTYAYSSNGINRSSFLMTGRNNTESYKWRTGTQSIQTWGNSGDYRIDELKDFIWHSRLFIESNTGNVGIGTHIPDSKLHVVGQIKITGGVPGTNKILTSDATGLATWETVSAVGLVGSKGDKGDTGDTGGTGSKGDKGDTGDAGPSTDTYAIGGDVVKGVGDCDYNLRIGLNNGSFIAGAIDVSTLASDNYVSDLTLVGSNLTLTQTSDCGVDKPTVSVDLSSLTSGLMGGADNDWDVAGNNMNTIPTGNVGIGVGSPTAKLHISNPAASTVAMKIGRVSGQPSIQSTDGWLIMDNKDSGTAVALNYYVNDKVILAHGGGDVGIGLINPLAKLHIYTNDSSDAFKGETLYSILSYGGAGGVGNKTNNVVLQNKTGGGSTSSSWQTRTSDDEISIEITTYFSNNGADISYNALVMNSGTGTVNILGATNDADTAVLSLQSDSKIAFQSHSISWPSTSKETMTIDIANDRVGINKPAPDVEFHVEGQVKIQDGTQGDGKVLTSDVNGLAAWKTAPTGSGGSGSNFAMPIGSIIQYGGSSAPAGWLMCDGSIYSNLSYHSLYNVIGLTYGGGESTDGFGDESAAIMFSIPDLRSRVPVGRYSSDSDFDILGEKGGEKEVLLTAANVPYKSHTHAINEGGSGHWHPISWVHSGTGNQTGNSNGERAQNVLNGHHLKHVDIETEWTRTGDHGFNNTSTPPNGSHAGGTEAGGNTPKYDTTQGEHSHSMTTGTASSNSSGTHHNNLQPYIVLNYIIYAGV